MDKINDKPCLRISESGTFEDQYYHTRIGSQAMNLLKQRHLSLADQRSRLDVRKSEVDIQEFGLQNGGFDQKEMFTNADILHSGYLRKEGSFWKSWKNRYFILRKDRSALCYYSSKFNLTKLGEIGIVFNTNICSNRTSSIAGALLDEVLEFSIVTDNRELKLEASSMEDKMKWIEAINACKAMYNQLVPVGTPFRNSVGVDRKTLRKGNIAESFLLPNGARSLPESNKLATISARRKEARDNEVNFALRTKDGRYLRTTLRRRTSDPEMYKNDQGNANQFENVDDAFNVQSCRDLKCFGNLERKKSSPLHRLSVLGMEPEVCVELSLSFGISGSQPAVGMFVVVSASTSLNRLHSEVGRTEIHKCGEYRRCGSKYSLRDFIALVRLPKNVKGVLYFEVFAVRESNAASDLLSNHYSIAYGQVPVNELLSAINGSALLSLERTISTAKDGKPNKLFGGPGDACGLILVVESSMSKEYLKLHRSFTFAQKSFLLSCVQKDFAIQSVSKNLGSTSISANIEHVGVANEENIEFMPDTSSSVLAVEELSFSILPVSIAIAYIETTVKKFENIIIQHTEAIEALKTSMILRTPYLEDEILNIVMIAMSNPPKNLEDRSVGEPNYDEYLRKEVVQLSEFQEVVNVIFRRIFYYEHVIAKYEKCKKHYEIVFRSAASSTEPGVSGSFKRSAMKGDQMLSFLPANVCNHICRAFSNNARTNSTAQATKSCKIYHNLTHGCTADHAAGYKEGGLRRMVRDFHRVNGVGLECGYWQRIERREEVVQSQILGVALTSFSNVLSLASLGSKTHLAQLALACRIGYFLNVESLLSTIGNEKGMLEDMDSAVKWLNTVSIRVILLDKDDTGISRCLGVSALNTNSLHRTIVSFAVKSDEFATISPLLGGKSTINIFAALFTQGINEKQSVANSVLDTRLQDVVNSESFAVVAQYFERYKNANPGDSSIPAIQTQFDALYSILCQQDVSKKNVNILIKSSDLCRRLLAGRTTCCKSGKDRTSMSVTLEASRVLVNDFGVHHGIQLCHTMRLCGVRRTNAFVNTGSNKYAFNSFQVKYLPDCYRPPLSSINPHNIT